MKNELSTLPKRLYYLLAVLIAGTFIACNDENKDKDGETVFDPSKPVAVSDFTPKSGGSNQKLVIMGDNFGNDKSQVSVIIGNKPATVITVSNTRIYCFVPPQAYDGSIKVIVGAGRDQKTGICEKNFEYERKQVVATLCGYKNEYDNQGWRDGSFADCCGFARNGWLAFDPKNPDHLYIAYDGKRELQMLDLANRTLSTPMGNISLIGDRLRAIDFTPDGNHMLMAIDWDSQQQRTPNVYIASRDERGEFSNDSPTEVIASYKQCNGVAVHPKNGEIYFNSYERSQLFRLDLKDYFDVINAGEKWNPIILEDEEERYFSILYTLSDPNFEYRLIIHPTGKYAYIIVCNRHYILRTDYDPVNKRFVFPYVVVGAMGQNSWVDGLGNEARMDYPYQGVFVKNSEYAGMEDEYDFYFTDQWTHSIRYVTPEGALKTFAGRGNQASGNVIGFDDGDLRETARFNNPTGIAYSESRKTFYILDTSNRRIRTISLEGGNSEHDIDLADLERNEKKQ